MANDTSTVHPSNGIVANRRNLTAATKNVETATNVYPGRLVMKGTNDDDVVVADGSTILPMGWAGYEDTAKGYRPATKATIYEASDKIAVLRGPGMWILGKLGDSASTSVGTILTDAAAGCLTPATEGTNHVVAVALEAVTTTTAAADILVESLI